MDFRFAPAPGRRELRPILQFSVADRPKALWYGLVDSGAMGTRLDIEIAKSLDIDLSGLSREQLSIGGRGYYGFPTQVELSVGGITWTANVSFVEDWDHGHQILGLKGFFDRWVVRIDAPASKFYLRKSRNGGAH